MRTAVRWLLDHACAATGHAGACGLLTGRFYFDCDDEDCRTLRIPLLSPALAWLWDWSLGPWDD